MKKDVRCYVMCWHDVTEGQILMGFVRNMYEFSAFKYIVNQMIIVCIGWLKL